MLQMDSRSRTKRRVMTAVLALLLALLAAPAALAAAPAERLAPPPAVPSGAFGEGGFDGEQDRVAVRLLTDRGRVIFRSSLCCQR